MGGVRTNVVLRKGWLKVRNYLYMVFNEEIKSRFLERRFADGVKCK
jgi:hypothetical protein